MKKSMCVVCSMVLLTSVMTVGCATTSTGTKVDANRVKQIERGTTTESDVVQMFGKPDSVKQSAKGKTLVYSYTKAGGSVGFGGILLSILTLGIYTPINTEVEQSSLTVSTENGIVTDYVTEQGSQKGSS